MTTSSPLPAAPAPGPLGPAPGIRALCLRILEGGSLDDKLCGSVNAADDAATDPDAIDVRGGAAASVDVDTPARSGVLVMVDGADKLPALNELKRADARVACLSRFAHHELMAVELFAWALVKFPHAPRALRRGLWAALVEEQAHLRLYLDRMKAHGAALGDVPLSGYFWKLVPAMRGAPDPLKAFLCTQGLTLEQANLDFTVLFRDAFRNAGDVESAAVLQQVHDDEIGHVRLARTWLCRSLAPDGDPAHRAGDRAVDRLDGAGVEGAGDDVSDVDAYVAHVPFPLSAARAKGRRFEVGARRRAGLSEPFIEHVRAARPYEKSPRPADGPAAADEREPA